MKHNGKQNAASIPAGSTCLETLMASDVAISWFAEVMAKIKQLGCNTEKYIKVFSKVPLTEWIVNPSNLKTSNAVKSWGIRWKVRLQIINIILPPVQGHNVRMEKVKKSQYLEFKC